MKKAIEIRYAVLTNLAMLLWQLIEFAIGFEDKYISWYPVVTLCSLVVPALCYRRGFHEKKELLGKRFTLGKAVTTGLLLTLFTSLLSIPVQLFFLKVINPDFMETVIKYAAINGKQTPEVVAMYINLQSLIIENAIFIFISGMVITFILALRYKAN